MGLKDSLHLVSVSDCKKISLQHYQRKLLSYFDNLCCAQNWNVKQMYLSTSFHGFQSSPKFFGLSFRVTEVEHRLDQNPKTLWLKLSPAINKNLPPMALIPQFRPPRRESYIVSSFQPWFSSLAEHKDGVCCVTSPCSHTGAISIMDKLPQPHV